MMGALRPVETLPRKTASGWFECSNIETHVAKPFDTGWRHLELSVRCRKNIAPFLHASCDGNPDLTGKVIVTTTAKPELQPLWAERLPSDRGFGLNCCKLLQRMGNVRASKAIIAMPSLCLDQYQPTCKQLGEMGTRSLCSNASRISQLARWQRTSIQLLGP